MVCLRSPHLFMARPRISTTISHKARNQLAWLCERNRRPLNNMLESLVGLAFDDAVSQLPAEEKQAEIEAVFSPSTYFSSF